MVVLDESKYKDKFNTLLESGVDEPLSKVPATKIERELQKLLFRHKTFLPTYLKHKLTPYHDELPHLCDFPIEFHWSPLLCPDWFSL
jgi:hypothetical protein